MKKNPFIPSMLLALILYSCETRTYEDISAEVILPQTVSYAKDIKPVIDNNCIICHSAGGISGFYPLTDYNLVKNAADNILDRIQRPTGDPQKMPQGGALSQANIDLIKKWKIDGLQP